MDLKTYLAMMLGTALIITTVYLSDEAEGSSAQPKLSEFMRKHGKEYSSPLELEYRLGVFAANLKFIERENAKEKPFKVGVNAFADLSWDEFKSFYLMKPAPNPSFGVRASGAVFDIIEGRKDWVEEGKVSPVKNQGYCGSCWAFSAIGAMESALAVATGKIESLSAQELVDCSASYGNSGCNGGMPSFAYEYIIDHKIAYEKDYPYVSYEKACSVKPRMAKASLSGYEFLKNISQKGIVDMLMRAPVSIGLEAKQDFMFYTSGVYTSDEECGQALNHAVLLTGYDATQETGFFNIQNSWGVNWGDNGFARIGFGTQPTGTCGMINKEDLVPLVQPPA